MHWQWMAHFICWNIIWYLHHKIFDNSIQLHSKHPLWWVQNHNMWEKTDHDFNTMQVTDYFWCTTPIFAHSRHLVPMPESIKHVKRYHAIHTFTAAAISSYKWNAIQQHYHNSIRSDAFQHMNHTTIKTHRLGNYETFALKYSEHLKCQKPLYIP